MSNDRIERLEQRVQRIEDRLRSEPGPVTIGALYTALVARFDQLDAEQRHLADQVLDTQRMILEAATRLESRLAEIEDRLDDGEGG